MSDDIDTRQFDKDLSYALHKFCQQRREMWEREAAANKWDKKRLHAQIAYSTAMDMLQVAAADPQFAIDLLTAANYCGVHDESREAAKEYEASYGKQHIEALRREQRKALARHERIALT